MNPLHQALTVEHYTPVEIVEAARMTLGRFDLDPASNELANQIVRADVFLSERGLEKEWHGRIFLNPPGKSTENPKGAAAWWHKLVDEFDAERVKEAVFIGFSLEILQTVQASERWERDRHPLSFVCCIPKRRIKFDKVKDGVRRPSSFPTHGNVIVCLAHEDDTYDRFRMYFDKFGFVT